MTTVNISYQGGVKKLTVNGMQDLCIQERSHSLAATRIQMVISIHLGWWTALVLMLHASGLQFTKQQNKVYQTLCFNNTEAHGEYQ